MQLDEAIVRIKTAHRERRFAMGIQAKLDNSLRSVALSDELKDRRWDDLTEAERDKLSVRAKKLIYETRQGAESESHDRMRVYVDAINEARGPATKMRRDAEKRMEQYAVHLPVYEWWMAVPGLGACGLATVIAEAGDLSNYPGVFPAGHAREGEMRPRHHGPGCLYKRLGFAPYDGCAGSTWKRDSWRPRKLTAEEWIANPFSSRRYSFIHQVGTNCIKMKQMISKTKTESGRSEPNGAYGEHYCYAYARSEITHPEWTPAHRDAHALRYAIKKLLRDTWREWRGIHSTVPETVICPVSSANQFADLAHAGEAAA